MTQKLVRRKDKFIGLPDWKEETEFNRAHNRMNSLGKFSATLQKRWDELMGRIAAYDPALASEADQFFSDVLYGKEPSRRKKLYYGDCRTAIDAVVLCLSVRPNVWRSTDGIIREILTGGFRRGEYISRTGLRQSIRYALHKSKKLVRRADGLLGLPGWKE